MLIIAASSRTNSRSANRSCTGPPTFFNRLVTLFGSFIFVSVSNASVNQAHHNKVFAVFLSALCGIICEYLQEVSVVKPLFEGFSGGAFIGAVAGIMIPETRTQMLKSGCTGSIVQAFGMCCFVSGITTGMLLREMLFLAPTLSFLARCGSNKP